MKFYSQLGYLILGSRLRRISAYFIAEVNKVYSQLNIEFDASWFPVFYLLSRQPHISLADIAEQLQTSHSAVSQLISGLRRKGLILLNRSPDDARKQLVRLSPEGESLLEKVEPVWKAIEKSMQALPAEDERIALVLPAISALEAAFEKQALASRVIKQLE